MQAKIGDFLEFSRRVDTLAGLMHVNLSDLPDKLGISQSLFWAYRSGKLPISNKSWKKLFDLEIRSGLQKQQPMMVAEEGPQTPYGHHRLTGGELVEAWERLTSKARAEIADEIVRLISRKIG